MTEKVTLTGSYDDPADAQRALQALIDMHLPTRDLRVAAVTDDGVEPVLVEHRVAPGKGAIAGAFLGGAAGMTAVVLASLANPAVLGAASAVAVALQGGAAGAAVGGLAGTFGGLGYWKIAARLDQVEEPDQTRFLIGARVPRFRADMLRDTLKRIGADRIRRGPLAKPA